MRVLILLSALFYVGYAFSSESKVDQVIVYGFDKTSEDPKKPSAIDRLVQLFNSKYAANYGFTVNYENQGDLIEKALFLGVDLIEDADIVQIKDIIHLGEAKQAGFFQSVASDLLKENIPQHLRAVDQSWFAMTKRARVIFYNPDFVNPKDIPTYESLMSPQWKGKLCLRVSGKSYNKALGGFFLNQKGKEETEAMLSAYGKNAPIITAVDMEGRDSTQLGVLEAVHKGICHVGIANTYYFGFFAEDHPDTKIRVVFPNQDSYGTHINLTAYGVVKTSSKLQLAQKFLEWMSLPEAQNLISNYTHKYPTNTSAQPSAFLQNLGGFIENKTFDFEAPATLYKEAYKLMVKAGWSDQPTDVKGLK